MSELIRKKLALKYGEWAVITGASSGIGLEIAERLAEAGLNVVLNARRKELLEVQAKQFEEKYSVKTLIISGDVSEKETLNEILAKTHSLKVGLFVASAGFGTSGLFVRNAIEVEVEMLRVNCESLLILTHHFAKVFSAQKRGGIILMSSIVAFQGVPFSANYAATKAYVQSLAEGLAVELAPFGVDVLSAIPGPVKSGFEARANMKMENAIAPEQIGNPILAALGKQSNVVPGFLSKVLVYSLATLPRWAKVKVMKNIMQNMAQNSI